MTRDFTLFNSLPLRTRHERLWQIGDTSFPGQSVYACTLGACAAFEQMSGRRPDWLA
jgi:phytoene dehydrogenase-like protein